MLDAAQARQIAAHLVMAAEWLDGTHKDHDQAQHALRQSTRDTYPDVADLLQSGDRQGAGETFLAHLETTTPALAKAART